MTWDWNSDEEEYEVKAEFLVRQLSELITEGMPRNQWEELACRMFASVFDGGVKAGKTMEREKGRLKFLGQESWRGGAQWVGGCSADKSDKSDRQETRDDRTNGPS